MSMTDIPAFGMPAFLTITQLTSTVTATVDGEAVTLTGSQDYSPGRAANLDMSLPTASRTRTGSGPIASVVVSKIAVGMTVNGAPATMNCLPAVATQLSLGVSTAQPQAPVLTATITPSNATGTVQFYEGTTKLGSAVPIVSGVATKSDLAHVSLGAHTYSAKYLPTTSTGFVPSDAAPVAATVGTNVFVQAAGLQCSYGSFGASYAAGT